MKQPIVVASMPYAELGQLHIIAWVHERGYPAIFNQHFYLHAGIQ